MSSDNRLNEIRLARRNLQKQLQQIETDCKKKKSIEVAAAAVHLYRSGFSYAEIGTAIGLSANKVSQIVMKERRLADSLGLPQWEIIP